MRYRRNEGFRFLFSDPIPAHITTEEVNGDNNQITEVDAKLIDLSPNGMKINTMLNIPISSQMKISIYFTLNTTAFHVYGDIIWKKRMLNSFLYGVHFYIGQKEQECMIENIKIIARSTVEQG